MPTTSNFGWTTPADTDLVKDGAAAIRTLGDGIDSSFIDLKGGTTGQVLAKASNTDLDFSWVAQDDSNAIQNALLTTTGDTIYASATSTPARLGIGSNGQVLTVSGGVPAWVTPAIAGKVLQVMTAVKSDTASSTSTTLTGTGLSASITPSAASSKILVLATFSVSGNPTNTQVTFGLYRGATQIFLGDSAGSRQRSSGTSNISNGNYLDTNTLTFLDSPSTTSSTTYEVYYRSEAGATVYLNRSNGDSDASWTSRTASSITLLEIGA